MALMRRMLEAAAPEPAREYEMGVSQFGGTLLGPAGDPTAWGSILAVPYLAKSHMVLQNG